METLQGIQRSPDLAQAQGKFSTFFQKVTVIPVTMPIAERCALLRHRLRGQGRRFRARALDLLIAATAIEYGLILVTRNVDDYRDILALQLHQSSGPLFPTSSAPPAVRLQGPGPRAPARHALPPRRRPPAPRSATRRAQQARPLPRLVRAAHAIDARARTGSVCAAARGGPRRLYASIHTHPGSSAFSDDDAIVLVTHEPICVMVVIGADGTWYLLSTLPSAAPPQPTAIGQAFADAVDALTPAYQAQVDTGALSPATAWREMSHRIWNTIANSLGLRYHRVEVERR